MGDIMMFATKFVKKILSCLAMVGLLMIFGLGTVEAAPGDLDASFGTGGKAIGSGSTNLASLGGMAVQNNGKILRAGLRLGDAAVTRYNADGSIDKATFNPSGGEPGTVTVDLLGTGSPEDAITAVAVQPNDGKIVVVGFSHDGPPFLPDHFALIRLNSDGSLDTGFGTGGRVATVISSSDDDANAVAIDANGKIVVAGFASTGGHDFVAVRYNSDGSLDTTFNSGGSMPGVATADLSGAGSNDLGFAMALQGDGKIVVAGESNAAGDFDFAVARFNADGTLDATFNPTGTKPGTATTNLLSTGERANAVAIQSDGRIVLAGNTDSSGSDDFALVRYNADGTLDTSFNAGGSKPGTVTTDFSGSGSTDFAEALAFQADGKIVVVGPSQTTGLNPDFALARYSADGTLDTTFGTGGKVLTDFTSNSNDQARGVAVLGDGKILVGGDSGDFALARYAGDVADLAVTKTVDATSVTVGANVTYTITVTNHGPDAASGATLTDNPPGGLTLVSATASAGSCSAGTPIHCDLGTIANGASVSFTVVALPSAAGTFSNTASVTSLTFDPDTTNNSGSSQDVTAAGPSGGTGGSGGSTGSTGGTGSTGSTGSTGGSGASSSSGGCSLLTRP